MKGLKGTEELNEYYDIISDIFKEADKSNTNKKQEVKYPLLQSNTVDSILNRLKPLHEMAGYYAKYINDKHLPEFFQESRVEEASLLYCTKLSKAISFGELYLDNKERDELYGCLTETLQLHFDLLVRKKDEITQEINEVYLIDMKTDYVIDSIDYFSHSEYVVDEMKTNELLVSEVDKSIMILRDMMNVEDNQEYEKELKASINTDEKQSYKEDTLSYVGKRLKELGKIDIQPEEFEEVFNSGKRDLVIYTKFKYDFWGIIAGLLNLFGKMDKALVNDEQLKRAKIYHCKDPRKPLNKPEKIKKIKYIKDQAKNAEFNIQELFHYENYEDLS